MRTLTLRELNRATLARQLLLRRHRLSLQTTIERVAGLQAQWPSAPYVGLWSRVADFRREALERALSRQQVLKATLMRVTLHLITARDYPTFTAAIHGGAASPIPRNTLELGHRLADDVRTLFADGPRTRREVFDWLEANGALRDGEYLPWTTWFAIKTRAHIVHAPSTAMWKGRPAGRYVALVDVVMPDPVAARVEVVRRYLGAFGPATRADIAQWSGLRIRDLAPAIEALEPLRRFRDERGRELLDLGRVPLPPADAPAPIRFLPKWDNLLLAHDDRRRILADEHRKAMIAINGEVAQSFLVDGFVAGTWSVEGGRVRIEPYAPLPRQARREVEAEAALLESFIQ
jgi:hypothetical protein